MVTPTMKSMVFKIMFSAQWTVLVNELQSNLSKQHHQHLTLCARSLVEDAKKGVVVVLMATCDSDDGNTVIVRS